MVERQQPRDRVEEVQVPRGGGDHLGRIEHRREIEQRRERDGKRVVDVVVEHRERRDRQGQADHQEQLDQEQHRQHEIALGHPVMVEDRQHGEDQAHLHRELDQPRAGGAEDEDLAGERDAAGQPRVLGKDVGAGVERLEHEVPDEVAAQQEGPVVGERDPNHVAEHHAEDRHGEERVHQCPDEAEQRALVLHLEVAHHEAVEQLPVAPDASHATERADHAAYRSRRSRARRRARG